MISVCLASFNGSKYIEEQIKSILIQIELGDEIVVVDDASEDNTVAIARNLEDPRIKIFQNDRNVGVIGSFERSMRLAQGDIIFLSDQDDVWLPNKVSKIMQAFWEDSAVTLCLSDAMIVDAGGEVKKNTYFEQRGAFKHGVVANVIKNKFLGCSIAFKKSLIMRILPFPSEIPAHDMWIGLINEIYGKSTFINEPLFQYRRHSENVSSMVHENLLRMLRWRIILIYQLTWRVFRNYLVKGNNVAIP